jgi:N-methylhydantoinase B/oxoprolinase/acetone carboxylase alpha subunit
VNGAGKEMLENSIKIINARIEKMTKNGVFDGTNLNTLIADSAYGTNPQMDLKPMVAYLRSMNDEQKELYKRLIINYYVKKGYKVVEGNNNFTNDFHYSINW